MKKTFFGIWQTATVVLTALALTACGGDSTDDNGGGGSGLSGLQIYYGIDDPEAEAGETIVIPFTISGVEGKTLALSAETSNEYATVAIKNDATYAGTIRFTAPAVMAAKTNIVVTLKAEDAANNRTTSNDITVSVAASETFAASWVGDMQSVALKPNDSFKVFFEIAGASADVVTLTAPVATVGSGYSATVVMSEKTKGYVNVTAPASLTSSVDVKIKVSDNFSRSSEINKTLTVVAVQSTSGAANSYIVPVGGTKAINAKVKGNSTEPLEFDYATLVWQDAMSLVKTVAGNSTEGVIVVELNSGVTGNAVVAAVKGDVIVWSWHVWATDYDPESAPLVYTNETTNVTYTMMDRNLGAKTNLAGTADCFGLLYQWGRKDPFVGARGLEEIVCIPKYDIKNNVIAERNITFAVADSENGTNLNMSIANPDAFIYCSNPGSATFSDWYTMKAADQNSDLWGYVSKYKSMYDPCPEGWRVAPSTAWTFRTKYKKAGNLNDSSSYDSTYPWYWDDVTDCGFYYNDSAKGVKYYFPMSGVRNNADGNMKSTGGSAQCASPEPSQNYTMTQMFAFGNPASATGLRRDYGSSIRCVKEYNY